MRKIKEEEKFILLKLCLKNSSENQRERERERESHITYISR